jgi:tetratricopeptide (TPR) repeat protein
VLVLSKTHQILGDVPRGAQVIRRYIEGLGGKAKMTDHLMLARYLVEAGDSSGALSAYGEAISLEGERRGASRELADLYFRRGIYDRAVVLYRELYDQFPEDSRVGLRLADVLIKNRDFDEASQLLSGLGDIGPSGDALRALIATNQGDHEEAIRLVSIAIDADPGQAVLFYERAAIYSQNPDRLTEAMQDLNAALTLNPGHLLSRRLMVGLYVKQGQRNEAIRELRTMVSRNPSYAEGRLMLIQMLSQDGELTSARLLTRAGIELTPENPTWYSVMAGLAIKSKQPQEAIDSFKTVLELAPTPGNLLTLASYQINNDRAAEATAVLREYAEMVNQQPVLQAAMGRALLTSGSAEQSNQVSSRALERSKNFDQLMAVVGQLRQSLSVDETEALLKSLANPPSKLWVGLALAQLQLQRGDPDAAVQQLMDVESLVSAQDEPGRQAYDLVLAISLHHAGKAEQALPIYQRAEKSQPDNTSVLNNMAYLLAEDLNRPQEALPLVERALKLSPGNAQILDTLGWVQFKLGQTDQAKATLETSIAAQPLSANHLHLARVLKEQGYKAQARQHLKTAADLAEQNNETDILQEINTLLEEIDQLTEALLSP